MSALTVDHTTASGHEWDDLVRIWQETDAPEGCKVEIIEGIVTVAPPPSNAHNDIADLVQRRLYREIPEDWGIYQTLGTAVPSRAGLYIPDLAVAPRAALYAEGSDNYIPAAAAELVVEITSKSNASNDRIKKAAGYAQAGVPLYLLIDSWAPGGPTVTLYGEPKGDVYRVLRAGKFGDAIELPEPFAFTLDTSVFPTT
ncbi:Uma2 family endonuclease [Streptomyces sp. CA-210063]|uniref:Uma2 family endonuclease n=1 Tax=Streptomyces sp. CA-210063 TaxID=2801029 RepID=UPI00214B6CF0|nr:Uma2 family endonuclease [Streptomyces sp. CA-210063]UUU31322.1 Uma2 family endonuclease [Streptomyces sp. CA-210063]